ncbi:hypothetical protein M430DRAFT_267637 [Amorphotheca resinae ATCC 22711]|uniref:Uncharacterized protein n=1 Tax=Amorphotheca resinae ATCC 22711 TaxID=857342 RepID=A0A2T3AXB5_AMORE|nr:hypothetical protein M430DRAFT_267637 [Amorphotheca resinae ATCC 22711]PSS13308.1 hypothetical protein M430DRAFT_267637 [Amorphotheca resinae ATCC 22711]
MLKYQGSIRAEDLRSLCSATILSGCKDGDCGRWWIMQTSQGWLDGCWLEVGRRRGG